MAGAASPALVELQPGESVLITVVIQTEAGTPGGNYAGWLSARGETVDSIAVRLRWLGPRVVTILPRDTTIRQGDVLDLQATITRQGTPLPEAPSWSVLPASAGFVTAGGAFVAYEADTVRVAALARDGAADTARLFVVPRGASGSLQLSPLGNGAVLERYTSDLWVIRSNGATYAYTGTWGLRSAWGNTLYAWDVTNPLAPLLTDSVTLDASTVNDVKVSVDGALAVATHEVSSDGLNGITLLDLTPDPAHPSTIGRYTAGLGNGVHNTWIEKIGAKTYVFAVHDGDPFSGLQVIDVTNPASPATVATFGLGNSVVHDVLVRDSLAIVSHWNDGLVMLDVGAGIAGGRPDAPTLVSHLPVNLDGLSPALLDRNVHNAWYWPARGLVFVGHELGPQSIGTLSNGLITVVDVSDLPSPRKVATFRLAGAGPHNFWLDESAGVLYAAYYNAGLLAIDVSGRLLGDLDRQGRLIAQTLPGGPGNTHVWAPQLVAPGLVLLSDMITGLWTVSVGP